MAKYALQLNNTKYIYVHLPYTDVNNISIHLSYTDVNDIFILNTPKLGNWYHSKIAAAMAIHVLNFYYKNNKVDVVDTDTLEIVDITLYNKIWNFCYQNKDITPCGFYPVNIDEQSDKKFFVLSQAIHTKENYNNIENIFKNEIIQLFKKETPVISELKQPYTLNKYYYFYTNDEVALVKYRLCSGNRILLFDTSKPQS